MHGSAFYSEIKQWMKNNICRLQRGIKKEKKKGKGRTGVYSRFVFKSYLELAGNILNRRFQGNKTK